MFKVNLPRRGGLLEVKFFHGNPNGPNESSFAGTRCTISNDNFAVAGDSLLHPLDYNSYCKETGRKIALHRALKNLGIGKAERTKVWVTYFATKEKHRSSQATRTLYEKEKE